MDEIPEQTDPDTQKQDTATSPDNKLLTGKRKLSIDFERKNGYDGNSFTGRKGNAAMKREGTRRNQTKKNSHAHGMKCLTAVMLALVLCLPASGLSALAADGTDADSAASVQIADTESTAQAASVQTADAESTDSAASVQTEDGTVTTYDTIEEAFDAANAAGTATVTLLDDCETSATLTVDADTDLTLDLAGHTIAYDQSSKASVLTIKGELTLNDSSGTDAGEITGGIGSSSSYGGGLHINSGAMVIINGGRITGNYCYNFYGTGIYNAGTLVINGGEITGNTGEGTNQGGGIYVTGSGSLVTMNGGEISNNASRYGGAVYLGSKAIFVMNDGALCGNETTYSGSAVYVSIGTEFTMNGGSITSNACTGSNYYSAVYVGGTFTMNGGEITGNTATKTAAGVYSASASATVNLGGTVVIKDNTLNGTPANLYLNNTTVTFTAPLSEGSYVGITTAATPTEEASVQITTAEEDTSYYNDNQGYLCSDNRNYYVANNEEGGYLELRKGDIDYATGMSLSATAITIENGWEKALSVSLLPTDTTEGIGSVLWTSSDVAVASVSGDGDTAVVTGGAIGSAVITVTVTTQYDSVFTTTCAVTIKEPDVIADFETAYEDVGAYLQELADEYGIGTGSVGGEWMALGMARAGILTDEEAAVYYAAAMEYIEMSYNEETGQLHSRKSTENSRLIVALTALGYDVSDIEGYDLIMGLSDFDYVCYQGINGPIWALIALDCGAYEITWDETDDSLTTREKLITYLLEHENPDGGWCLSEFGTTSDVDITAMAIQALAPYYDTDEDVRAAVDRALVCLSEKQEDDGGFSSIGTSNNESCAQVVVALTALGIDPATDSRFVKYEYSVLDAMLRYYVPGGGFIHVAASGTDGMATEQGYYAMVAYYRYLNGMNTLYDMTEEQNGTDDTIGTTGTGNTLYVKDPDGGITYFPSLQDAADTLTDGDTLVLTGDSDEDIAIDHEIIIYTNGYSIGTITVADGYVLTESYDEDGNLVYTVTIADEEVTEPDEPEDTEPEDEPEDTEPEEETEDIEDTDDDEDLSDDMTGSDSTGSTVGGTTGTDITMEDTPTTYTVGEVATGDIGVCVFLPCLTCVGVAAIAVAFAAKRYW